MSTVNPKALRDVIYKSFRRLRSSFDYENRMLALLCEDPEARLSVIADRYDQRYGVYKGTVPTEDTVYRVIRLCELPVNGAEREQFLRSLIRRAELIARVIDGSREPVPPLRNKSQEQRLILLLLAEKSAVLKKIGAYDMIFSMNRSYAAECLEDMLELIQPESVTEALASSNEDPSGKVERMRMALDRKDKLLRELQDNFDKHLEESRQEQQEEFMARLNSDEYGRILDLLLATDRDFRQMRRDKKPIPLELRDVQSLTRRLRQFVEDCGVTPVYEVDELGTQMELRAKQLDNYQFDGTPFQSEEEVKTVEIVSPGWQIAEKNMVISRPRVREIREETV